MKLIDFYINWANNTDDIRIILADEDTVMYNGIRPMKNLPKKLAAYFYRDTVPVFYKPEIKYQENIDNMATIPFYKKLDSGPFLNDD